MNKSTASTPSAAVKELAAALAKAAEEEQERLLAQEKILVDNSLLVALKELADNFFQKGEYSQALKIHQLAARIAERIGDRIGMGQVLCDIGRVYGSQNRVEQALDYLQKSLVICEEAGDKKGMARTLYYVGYTHALQSRIDQALEYFNRSLAISDEISDKNRSAATLNSIAVANQAQGRVELALDYYQKSQALSEELNDKITLIKVLNNIGDLYSFQGRYVEALAYLQKAVKLNEEMGNAVDKRTMGYSLHNIARVYSNQGSNDQALEYNRKSLKIREEINDKAGIAGSLNNIGVNYKNQRVYEQALEWLQKGLKLFEEVTDKDGVAIALNNIGDIYREQRRYDLALEYLRQSLRLHEDIGGRLGMSRSLKNLGSLYRDKGSYAEMLEVSRRSARLAEEVNAPEDLWKAQERIGSALRALGQPVEARKSFLDAIATIESLRYQVAGGAHQQQSFMENKLSPWIGIIELLVTQRQYTEALIFAEQSKARALIDTIQAGRASLQKSLSPQERQAEEQKRLHLVALNSQLSQELRRDKLDPVRMIGLKEKISKARLEFEALETSLYAAHLELKINRGGASIIKMDEMSGLLPDASNGALEYVVADDKTYLFTITKAAGNGDVEIQIYTLPIKREELAKLVEAFRQQLGERNLGFRRSAEKIYDLLLKPAEAQIKGKTHLIIVPDDKLWDLPFQALVTDGGRFLIENAAISYAPSLTALREMIKRLKKQNTSTASGILLALGNPLLGKKTIERAALALRDEKFDPLPEAEQEVKSLRRLYGVSRSKVYVGAEACEDRVKSEANHARILHFATHGIINNASPMYSHLALAQGDRGEDGLLEAWELMQLDLKAELAVLSACETARGRIGAGEGMIGLTWAMFIAGVPSTVVSQWKVESASTRDLMLNFHSRLLRPMTSAKVKTTKAEALRQASLNIMKNPETRHPFYWAGFALVGVASDVSLR